MPSSSRSARVCAVDIDGLVATRGTPDRGATDAQPTGSSSSRGNTPGLGSVRTDVGDEVSALLLERHRRGSPRGPPVELAPAVPLVARCPQHGLRVRDALARAGQRGPSGHARPTARPPAREAGCCGAALPCRAARAGARVVRRRARATCRGGRPDRTPVGRAGQRGDAAADAGRPGRAGLAGVDGALADAGRPRRRPDRRRAARVGPPGLPAPGAAPAGVRASRSSSGTTATSPTTEPGCSRCPASGSTPRRPCCAFAFGRRSVVVDTNVRRVLARTIGGAALRAAAADGRRGPRRRRRARRRRDRRAVGRRVDGARRAGLHRPGARAATPARWSTSAPGAPPVARRRARRPAQDPGFAGTDRQVRGRVMALLRDAIEPVPARRGRRAVAGRPPARPLPRLARRRRPGGRATEPATTSRRRTACPH